MTEKSRVRTPLDILRQNLRKRAKDVVSKGLSGYTAEHTIMYEMTPEHAKHIVDVLSPKTQSEQTAVRETLNAYARLHFPNYYRRYVTAPATKDETKQVPVFADATPSALSVNGTAAASAAAEETKQDRKQLAEEACLYWLDYRDQRRLSVLDDKVIAWCKEHGVTPLWFINTVHKHQTDEGVVLPTAKKRGRPSSGMYAVGAKRKSPSPPAAGEASSSEVVTITLSHLSGEAQRLVMMIHATSTAHRQKNQIDADIARLEAELTAIITTKTIELNSLRDRLKACVAEIETNERAVAAAMTNAATTTTPVIGAAASSSPD